MHKKRPQRQGIELKQKHGQHFLKNLRTSENFSLILRRTLSKKATFPDENQETRQNIPRIF